MIFKIRDQEFILLRKCDSIAEHYFAILCEPADFLVSRKRKNMKAIRFLFMKNTSKACL